MHQNLVSIVIPAYHADRLLEETLESIECQTHSNWELLVTEDASHDETENLVSEFAARNPTHRVVFTRHEVNAGPSASRNTGIELARGDFIALLDADDLWMPDHLRVSVEALCDTNADITYSTTLMFDDETRALTGIWGPNATECSEFPNGLYKRCFVVPSSTVIKSSVFTQVGFFDTDPAIQGCEDIDFWLRCVKSGCNFHHITGLHCLYRKGHEEAATSRMGKLLPRQATVLESHFGMPQILPSVQRQGLAHYSLLAAIAQLKQSPLAAIKSFLRAWRLRPLWLPLSASMRLAAACFRSFKSVVARVRP
ncbi:MAG: glycosyltransferase family A protein [Planctomycetota bacterium]